MKLLSLFLLSASTIAIITSCSKEPEENYPIEPTLTFESITFKRGIPDEFSITADTVVITIFITDGDGDFGRKPSEIGYEPFNEGFYINRNNGNLIPWQGDRYNFSANINDLIRYEDRSAPPFDTLPPMPSIYYADPFYHDSGPLPVEPTALIDYLYYKLNRDIANLMIDGYLHNDDGSFENLIDVFEIRGQYPPFVFDYNISSLESQKTSSVTVEALSPQKARVTLKIASLFWRIAKINGHHLKFNLTAKDHALHSSNTIETSLLTVE